MHRSTSAAVAISAIGALAGAAGGQYASFEYSLLAVEGDAISGVGAITEFRHLAINSQGEWLVEAGTDHPDPGADRVVLRTGALLLREGQALAEPAGARLASFSALGMHESGNVASVLTLEGTGAPAGVYWNASLVALAGEISSAPGLPPDTRYLDFEGVSINDSDQMLTLASLSAPAWPDRLDAFVALDYDPAAGTVEERIVAKEGDVLPGQVEPIEGFGDGARGFALGFDGRAAFFVDLAGSSDRDEALVFNGEILAQEGGASPVPGRNWGSFTGAAVGLRYTPGMRARLDGDPATSEVITWPWRRTGWYVVARQGGPVPGVAGATFTGFGDGPVSVTHSRVGSPIYWYGAWSGGEGLFRDDEPMLVAGEVTVEGRRIIDVEGGPHAFAASPNDRYLVARVTLEGGERAVVLVETTEIGCGECGADCDCNSVLDFFDVLCYQNAFASGHPYADCDGNGILDFFDFLCFLNSFAC